MKKKIINIILALAFCGMIYILTWQPFGTGTSNQIAANAVCYISLIGCVALFCHNNPELNGLNDLL